MKKSILTLTGLVTIMFIIGCASSRYYKLGTLEFNEIKYGFPVERIKIRNIGIGYIDQGDSDQVLLLIHGLGSNAKGWIKNIPVWANHYRVIAVDLPGYGTSDKGHYPYSMSFYAEVLTEFLDELGIAKATFVGHSMGGQIAMMTALNYSDRVDKLVLISTAGFERFSEGEGAWMKGVMTPELVRDTPIRNIDINLRMNFYETPPDAEFMITDRIQIRGAEDFELYCYAVSQNVDGMLNEPTTDRLSEITQPTLIIFGENDGLIPNPYLHGGKTDNIARIGEEGIADGRVIMMPKCGHFVMFEKWEETNRAVIEFLEGDR